MKMDYNIDEGEITVTLVGKKREFRDLYDDLRTWSASSQSNAVHELLSTLGEAGGAFSV